MKKTILGLICMMAAVFTSCTRESAEYFDPKEYGAACNGTSLDTKAIQDAIDAAFAAGGGHVKLNPGVYLSGTIFLKDNVKFEITEGATLLGSPELKDYTEMTWGHNPDRQPYHLLVVKDAANVTLCGGGTVDGNGPAFWQDYNPANDPQWIKAKDLKISPMAEIQNSKNVRVQDLTLKTGGGWTMHIYNSEHVQVRGVKILNNLFAPNGDGIDITGSSDVTISDCIIKTCDDAICLKTSVDSKECRRVSVTNCIMECSCVALKIGNESFRDISQVTFSNCIVYNSSRVLGIYAESAGTVEDITVNNIISDTKAPFIYNRPIHISLYLPAPGAGNRNGDWMFKDGKQWDYQGKEPRLRNVQISNFFCKTEGRILIAAEKGRYIENLTLRDVHLEYPWIEDPVPNIDRAKSSQFSPMNPDAKKARAAMVIDGVKNLAIENFMVTWPSADTVPAAWRHPKRIANGTFDSFSPDYSTVRHTELNALWMRNISKGYVRSPLLTSSVPALPVADVKDSDVMLLK